MKIEKFWGGEYSSQISIIGSRFCIEFMLHPKEWATPYIQVASNYGIKYIDFTFLCFTVCLAYGNCNDQK